MTENLSQGTIVSNSSDNCALSPVFEKLLGCLRLGKLQISSFVQDENLELYIATHQNGRIFRIVPAP